jgi:hypothetical protein
MPAECPNCRQPLPWYRTFITPLWGSWRCGFCEALLGVNKRRRLLGMIPWLGIVLLLVGVANITALGHVIALPTLVVVGVTYFVMYDRAVVLERTGFRCRECGYDLQGQERGLCPECGEAFSVNDLADYKTGVAENQPRRRAMGWVGWGALITISLLIVGGTFFVLGLIKYKKSTAPTAPPPPAAATPATDE